jgi:DNA repair exonuclease SbcCD ATPase subunit
MERSSKMIDLVKYENFLNQKKAAKNLLEIEVESLQTRIKDHQDCLANYIEALDIMNVVGILVQQEFEEVVEVLVTDALRFVFGDNYSFEIDSKVAHNQPEVHMFIVIDGERFSPEDDEFSGGQADVVSFAFRVILWAIQYTRTRATLLFDEPFRNLHGTENAKSIREMTQYLSKMLGLQFIIVTQDEELTRMADAAFIVTKERGISKVELIEKVRTGNGQL